MEKSLYPKLTIISKIILTSILLIGMAGCSGNAPIKIGLAVELTGARGLMGIAIRNGAALAVEQINEQGGINGRPVEIIIRDDKGDPETARLVDASLVEEEVVAIIGHATSQQSMAVVEQMNAAETVLLSPTANSPDLTAKDDYFFRVVQTNTALGNAFGKLIYEQGNQNLIGIIDLANQSYVETLWQAVRDDFSARGGDPLPEIKFYSSEELTPKEIVRQAAAQNPDAVLIIASDIDTAPADPTFQD